VIVTFQISYDAETYQEAIDGAEKAWREWIGQDDAVLPWNATVRCDGSEQLAHLSVKVDQREER
jgi:hypothetical protein